MRWFKNLKIRTKLLISFIVLAVFTAIVGVFGLVNLQSVNKSSQTMHDDNFVPSQNLKTIQIALQEVRANHLLVVYERDPEKYQDRQDTINKAITQTNELLSEYETKIADEQERELYDNLVKGLKNYREVRDKNLKLIEEQKYDKALKEIGEVTAARESVNETLSLLVEYNDKLANNMLQTNDNNYVKQIMLMGIIIAVCVILALLFGVYLSVIISKPVHKMVQAAQMLALGDISAKVEVATKDEIGNLADAFNTMIQNISKQALAVEQIATGDLTVEVEVRSENDLLGRKLDEMIQKNNEVLSNIASASEEVSNGAKQISDSSIALSQGATEQASTIEELTASLEEISSQTKLNAQNSNQVNELTEEARSSAVEGNSQMKNMLKSMEDINESSANISKIIKVIDDIAFQTNILALNAAVEAARAGQHGKGFAVVAEEVRNLAARSASAAKETTDMIEESIKKSEGGTKIAKETAEEFQTIVNRIENIAKLVNDITIASNEQAIGIEQINQGIMQVSEVVQTNSATSEEGAAASEELSSQAILLKEMVNQFKLRANHKMSNYNGGIDPEVMSMLETMMNKKKESSDYQVIEDRIPVKPKIALNDMEFGKY